MRIINSTLGLAVAAAATLSVATPSLARDNIQIAGSSTVLPFASIAAEEFGNTFPQFKAPVVGSGGTGGGMRQFCQGIGASTIDIANASRAMKPAEIESCHAAGVEKIIEVKIGYDGIVFASRRDKAEFKLEPRHIWAAIARQVPIDGKMIDNPYGRWNQIDKSLPNQQITLVIPASNHGTREVFDEKVLIEGCKTFKEMAKLEGDAQKEACLKLRQDSGTVVEIAGDYTETLARLQAQADAIGVFGLSFYESNLDRLQIATIDGVTATQETVISGEYPVSRPLFFYVKGEHIGVIPGLIEFAQFFVSDAVSGVDSPLFEAGLIPLSDDERAKVLSNIKNRKVVGK